MEDNKRDGQFQAPSASPQRKELEITKEYKLSKEERSQKFRPRLFVYGYWTRRFQLALQQILTKSFKAETKL